MGALRKLFSATKTGPVRAAAGWGLAALLVWTAWTPGCGGRPSRVVVYAAQDQVYAEPILKDFEDRAGVSVAAVYDSEAVKTVGLANRILAEKNYPQCDVFWGNEELRARQLAAAGAFRETNGWVAFGYRSRRIVVNTNLLDPACAPRSLLELTNAAWRGKVALAYPLFGTTAAHFAALRQLWGPAQWERWCRALAANKPFVVDGNSAVARLVARGEAQLGLTDSDDIAAVRRGGAPVIPLPMNEETLLIPNTVAVIRNAPHPEAADRLMRFLSSARVVRRLVRAGALEGASKKEVKIRTLAPDWGALLAELDETTERLSAIFLR